eukprot:SAG11_NODE_19262_length_470_cov_1.994609_1_plen_84_part_00
MDTINSLFLSAGAILTTVIGSASVKVSTIFTSLPTSTSGFTSANNGQLYSDSNGFVKVYTHQSSAVGGGSGGPPQPPSGGPGG